LAYAGKFAALLRRHSTVPPWFGRMLRQNALCFHANLQRAGAMADLPDRKTLSATLASADTAHAEYERTVLRGVTDEAWAGFIAAFVVGRLGEFVPAGRLALLISDVEDSETWADEAAEHVLMKLRS
jgi:hypothetical protein